ncbi:putative transcription factor interactor and regulator CCHC(Zn) family [Helianthus anomalus]
MSNCCEQNHMKQSIKFEQSANKSSNRSYNSNSSLVGSNGSGYAPYVKNQTCYNYSIPVHIARNCTHVPMCLIINSIRGLHLGIYLILSQ